MSYAIPTLDDIRGKILTVWSNLDQRLSTSRWSDAWIRSQAVAATIWGLYGYTKYVEQQIFPDTADGVHLAKHGALHIGDYLAAKAATSGVLRITGLQGSALAVGLGVVHADGARFETTSGGTIPAAGYLDVGLDAITLGAIGNKEATEQLTLTLPPAGVDATAIIQTSLSDGEDAESDALYLARLLSHLREPPAGGKASDYSKWTLEVLGVAEAYVYPLRRGLGTVDVVPLTTDPDRLPSSVLLASVQAYIDGLRPVTAYNTLVLAPTLILVDITATVWLQDGYTWGVVEPDCIAALDALFLSLAPGDSLYIGQIWQALMNVSGVLNADITVPADTATAIVDSARLELLASGTYSLSEGV